MTERRCDQCEWWEPTTALTADETKAVIFGYPMEALENGSRGTCRCLPVAEIKEADDWCGQFKRKGNSGESK